MNRIMKPEQKLRILMLAPTPYFSDRGCHVRIYEEAKALIQKGHQVRIVSYHLGRDLAPVAVDRTLAVPWYTKRDAGPSWHKLYLDLLLFFRALSSARHFRPDLIHAHLHEGVLVGWLLARWLRIPLLFDYQGSLSGESLQHGFLKSGSLLHRLFRFVERRLDRLADAIVTSSTAGSDELTQTWGVAPERVVSVPDGVDTSIFHRLNKPQAFTRLGLDEQVPVIVYLGLLNRYQGADLLLEAAKLLIQKGRLFHLVMMGFPEEQYRQRAVDLHIDGFVSFTGKVDYADAPLLLSAGDIAVSPKIASTEANGKLLNYMACGLPVVAFDTPVNRELLGDDGIYARLGDADDLARCLADALSDREQLRLLGRRMRERALAVHSWDRRVALLESAYLRLLDCK